MVRTFEGIRNEYGLRRFLASRLGTLHYVPSAPGSARLMVRRFDAELPPRMAAHYADVVRAAAAWVDRHERLRQLVRVEVPVEVGEDFVARPHHTYITSIDAYEEWEDPPAAPPELGVMRDAARAAIAGAADERDGIIARVLTRSLLEPTGKTYFNEAEGRFVIVDPKMEPADVQQWAALAPGGADAGQSPGMSR